MSAPEGLETGLAKCADFGAPSSNDRSKKLSEADRHRVGEDIQKIEFGWPLGRPDHASLGLGSWEARSGLDGNRTARVTSCIGDGHMILRRGFIEKTQEPPKADIDLAVKRMKDAIQ